MDHPQNCIRVSTIILFLCLLLHSEAKTPTELIMDVCKLSESNKKFCIETLKSNPKTAAVKDHKGIAEIALEMTKAITIKTSQKFRKLSAKHVASRTTTDLCAEYFEKAVGMLNLDGLKDGLASLDVHYASDNAQACENALAEAGVHIQAIPPAMQKWRNTFTIAMAAVSVAEGDVDPSY